MKEEGCRMRYVSSSGLVLEMQGEAVGIDIFSRDPAHLYPDTPPGLCRELLQEIEEGRLRALIFTHEHGDHFCLEEVQEARKKRPGLSIISTDPVIRTLREAWKENLEEDRLWTVPAAKTGEPVWIKLGPFRMGFLYTVHEGAQYAGVPNLTLLIEAAGQHWVIPGDAAASRELFAGIGAWSPTVDWFFLPFPYVGLRSSRRMLAEALKIRRAFVLHQPRPEADTQNWVRQARMVCSHSQDGLPNPVFPEKLGEWYEL